MNKILKFSLIVFLILVGIGIKVKVTCFNGFDTISGIYVHKANSEEQNSWYDGTYSQVKGDTCPDVSLKLINQDNVDTVTVRTYDKYIDDGGKPISTETYPPSTTIDVSEFKDVSFEINPIDSSKDATLQAEIHRASLFTK